MCQFLQNTTLIPVRTAALLNLITLETCCSFFLLFFTFMNLNTALFKLFSLCLKFGGCKKNKNNHSNL